MPGLFRASHVGADIRICGMTNAVNNGFYRIVSRASATTITVAAANGVTETSGFSWEIADGDSGSVSSYNVIERQGNLNTLGSDCKFLYNVCRQPDTKDLAGIVGSFSISGTTVTLSCPKGEWDRVQQESS